MKEQLISALEIIERLLRRWGLSKDNWMLAFKDAWILQGYNFRIGHNLDVIVNKFKLPWQVKEDFQAIPPRDSKELDQYINCIEKIGFGIHFIPLPQGKLVLDELKKTIIYRLPNKREIRLYKIEANVKALEYLLLEKCDLEKFDIRMIIKNFTNFKEIKKEALRKKQKDLIQLCSRAIKKVSKKYLIK